MVFLDMELPKKKGTATVLAQWKSGKLALRDYWKEKLLQVLEGGRTDQEDHFRGGLGRS